MSKRIRDDIEMFQSSGVHIPTRTLYIGSESSADAGVEHGTESGTDHAMAERLVKNLHILNSISAKPITIIMNNLGGDIYHGRAMIDAIRCSRSPITIKVSGQAMSMGAVILQAAKKRVMGPRAKLMMHYGHISLSGEAKTVYKWIAEYKRDDKDMENTFLERIHQRFPDYTIEELRKMLDHDTILDAQQTVHLGLADEVEEETK